MDKSEESLILVVAAGTRDVEDMTSALSASGFRVEVAASKDEAEALFRDHRHALALVDMRMPEASALDIIQRLKHVEAMLPVIVLADRSRTRDVAQAIERGAFDWVARPIDSAKLVGLVSTLVARRGELVRPIPVESGLREEPNFKKIVGSSDKIKNVFESIKIVTSSDVPVLIQGETGTGKELVARAIHYRGPRRKHPFSPVNCAAIPETLLESELFGHERGAFTGAVERRKGKFEISDHGTLFLDEIGEMPAATQAKILRVIEDHAFCRVGGSDPLSVDVRIISATNKVLPEEVRAMNFREDLYYRLSVFPIFLPPLRERRTDILELAGCFLQKTIADTGRAATEISPEAAQAMVAYAWPGNVRELQNTIRRAALLAVDGIIKPVHLGLKADGGQREEGDLDHEIDLLLRSLVRGEIVPLEKVEEVFIRQTLSITNGNITEAATRLGVSRSTIYRKLQEYGGEK